MLLRDLGVVIDCEFVVFGKKNVKVVGPSHEATPPTTLSRVVLTHFVLLQEIKDPATWLDQEYKRGEGFRPRWEPLQRPDL